MDLCPVRSAASRRRNYFLVGALIGCIAFLLVFGLTPLDVTNDAFLRGGFVEKDIQQHYAGWLFFRSSAWSFPLGVTTSINAPDGISIAFTDSIPLFAVLFKVLSPLLPATFQYFGWFSLLCYLLMGGFSMLLLDTLGNTFPACLAGSVLYCFSPVLVERTLRHTSLAAQFFIVAALYYYFRSKQENRLFYPGLLMMNALLLSIHPYFVPMAYAVTFALCAQYALRNRKPLPALGFLALNLSCTMAVGWLFGLFYGSSSGGSDQLYGYFGMNLNALWNPSSIGTTWSLLLPVQNQVGGNYDAFAYLGLGLLIGLAIAVVRAIRRLPDTVAFMKGNWVLLLVCGCLTAFAVSNVVTANGATLFTLPLSARIQSLASIFRSSGRLFWPVYYLLFAWIITSVSHYLCRRNLPVLLLVLCAVQLVDLSPALIARHAEMKQYAGSSPVDEFPTQLTSSFWEKAAGQYAHLFSLGSTTGNADGDSLHLALYAADNGMTTNDPFAARYDAQSLAMQREQTISALREGIFDSSTLYFTNDEGMFLQLAPFVQGKAYCAKVGENLFVIAPGFTESVPDAIEYNEQYPVKIADYTDQNWDGGVLDWDDKTILLTDCDLTRTFLQGATALSADEQTYPITEISDQDAGWLMVTLRIDDARILRGKELEAVK